MDSSILKRFRYFGKCKDTKNRVWFYYTNSKVQFDEFKKKKNKFGMKLIDGEENKNYKVVGRLL